MTTIENFLIPIDRAILSILLLLVQNAVTQADDRTRTFDPYHCKFTLPGKDWSWVVDDGANRVFHAENKEGFVVVLGCMRQPRAETITQEFVAGFEESLFIPGKLIKRGGQYLTYRGVPCYQAEGLRIDDQITVAARIFFAHGYLFQILVAGGNEPVEKTQEFESILAGFDFTVPPPPQVMPRSSEAPPDDPKNGVAYRVGKLVGYCLVFVFVFWVLGRYFRRSSR